MPDILANSIRIHYQEQGYGIAMIWAHGLLGTWRVWEDTMAFFQNRYRVIGYDARGHGFSEVPDRPEAYSQEIMVQDLRGIMDALAIDRAIIGGHSMGSNVALNFAISYPERCLACILVGAGAGSKDSQWRGELMGSFADIVEQKGMVMAAEHARTLPGWELLVSNPTLWKVTKQNILASSPRGIASTIRGVQMQRPTVQQMDPSLLKLTVKTLVVVGELDTPCLEESRIIAQRIPKAILKEVPNVDHFVHLEAPQEFLKAIEQFLSQ
jgi:pimeloyl-ACP methyl ester carboxylesterase